MSPRERALFSITSLHISFCFEYCLLFFLEFDNDPTELDQVVGPPELILTEPTSNKVEQQFYDNLSSSHSGSIESPNLIPSVKSSPGMFFFCF